MPAFAGMTALAHLHPSHVMPREEFTHGFHQFALRNFVLGFGLLFQILLTVLGLRKRSAENEILDLNLALCSFVRALDYRAGCVSLIVIFHLLTEAVLRIPEIKFGANICTAQSRNHLLVVSDLSSKHRDAHGTKLRRRVELAKHGQRRLQTRHADGKSRRGLRLARKARW